MDRLPRLIRFHNCGLTALLALLVSACATLPDKSDVVISKESFAYALRGTGKPAVVFEAGLGGGMDTWAPVFDKVAAFTTVFAYDRRGYRESGKPVDAPKILGGGEIARTAGEVVLDAVVPGASTLITIRNARHPFGRQVRFPHRGRDCRRVA